MLIDIGMDEIQTDLYEIDTQMRVYDLRTLRAGGLPVGTDAKSMRRVYPLATQGETTADSDIMPSTTEEAPCHA
jgi:hypothetical protein